MVNNEDPSGFLSRWSRRKADVREGKALEEPKLEPLNGGVAPATQSGKTRESPVEAAPISAPTLADVQQLTPESNFSDYMAQGVTPEVKNAAMKKLFTDPHFNVMDRMDVYIDDYSQPDPLPEAMLRQMVGAKFLNLFEEEPQNHDSEMTKVVAQSDPVKINSPNVPQPNDHADLRLQPDPASRPEGAGSEPV